MKNEKILKEIFELLEKFDETICTAESCTGGLICSNLTNMDGSSKYVVGSIVSYMTRIKTDFLDISKSEIEKYDVVSKEVSEYMAMGVWKQFDSSISISVTGYIDKEAYYTINMDSETETYRIELSNIRLSRDKVKDYIVNIILEKLRDTLVYYRDNVYRKI